MRRLLRGLISAPGMNQPNPNQAAGTPLDPLTIPLTGLHLIEASAGTGKTYAIAHLVLRLILDAGRRVDEILVLTFTEAATEELRERISKRLREARAALKGGDGSGTDSLLCATLAGQPDQTLALARLDAAIASLDRAAIRTIHGFCGRVLKDFAFESGAPFDAELITDEQDLRAAAAQDFWRRRMARADAAEAAWLLDEWPQGPASLLATLAPYLGRAAPLLLPAPGAAETGEELSEWSRLQAELLALHAELAGAWPGAREAVTAMLRDNPSLALTSYKPAAVEEAIAAMDAWCNGPPTGQPPARLALFTPEKLKGATKKKGTTPEHPFFARCERLAAIDPETLARARRAAVLADAYRALRTDLARLKDERRVIYFDDLLTRTAQALAGPRGPALAARIRGAHPVALIDEFQDTDDLQYGILRAIYGGQAATGLFLIGDPKQAIYGFRGADIFTYIAARRQAQGAGQVHTLDTNRRSAAALVATVNRLFGRVAAPFIFEPDIRFDPVNAWSDADREPLLIAGQRAAALVFRWLPLGAGAATKKGDRIPAEAARDLAVGDCARQIADLLQGAAAGTTRVGERALRAGDIAVLVRKHGDGLLIRDALAALDIGSVSIGQQTVFDSAEAEDLAALLAALAPGAGEARVRTALATRLLGWTAAELGALGGGLGAGPAAGAAAAEARWGEVLGRFGGYREVWRNRGFMAALDALIQGEQVPERLRRGPDGERRLTNLLHLAELAQAASREHQGHEGLTRWLADRRRPDGDSGGEAALLRLESDENLVQIVTFHKSKGLEYPVVFLPLPWSKGRGAGKQEPVAFHDRDTLSACLDLGSRDQEAHRALAAQEDLAERLRLLYVAVTRARHRCVIHWGPVNQAEGAAAAYLLHQGPDGAPAAGRMAALTDTELRAEVERLGADLAPPLAGSICIEDALSEAPPGAPAGAAPGPVLRAAVFAGLIPDDWRLLSFSALLQGRDVERPDYDRVAPLPDPDAGEGVAASVPDPESAPEPDPAAVAVAAQAEQAIDPVFRFPRGTRAGHCLHDLFEHLDFRDAVGPALAQATQSALARHGLEARWAETLAELVDRVLDTPLDRDGLRLRGLAPADRRNELEFHFAMDGFDPGALGAVLAAHGVPTLGAGGPAGAGSAALSGLMKGFVDLVMRVDGRFYILDYKSNHLGDSLDDYGPAGLARAMLQHGYHLQYLIYTVALHRYLRRRLPGYDYDQAIGGVRYLFLRGMRPAAGPDRGVFAARPGRALIADLDRLFGAAGQYQTGLAPARSNR
ncbi:exodeoxyribonuclease V subunit beta [Candidatus Thiodictyon syntrophicum]|uniref:RecBCD enzyme subunit RecB n=2 Tax=Candidatus Thiodictyon syntrophicum TaxID=1166950 RepID=A0A2K8U718_9GAMM|nr:exodeoxyribonuclease V subunit beta [Candidatus Thiodictyon syntrophicum]